MNKIGYPTLVEHRNNQKLKPIGEYEFFSFPTSSYKLSQHPIIKSADIINLHWVANFLDFPSFFKQIEKPIVWTLHDMNPFQGGFHYYEDVICNRVNYGSLEANLRELKKAALGKIDNLSVVAPSKWLLRESSKSEILGKYPHYNIPYGLDTKIYKFHDPIFARSVFNLPLNKTVLVFVSESIQNRRKGMDLLIKALELLKPNKDIIFCAAGNFDKKWDHESIVPLGRINDERLMPLLFSAADALILPSREDNLPNVMLESIACGTPVVSFALGGMLDVIENGKTGVLAESVTAESLKLAIEEFLETQFNRPSIMAYAHENFNLANQANKYLQLYKSIL